MSHYGEYVRERGLEEILEIEEGYVTYRYLPDEKTVYLIDIYIDPEFRRMNMAAELANTIASEARIKGCLYMLGTVVPAARNSAESARVLLAYGMKPHGTGEGLMIFRKEL